MLEQSRVRAGHWEGIWAGAEAPDLQVSHLEKDLPDLSAEKMENGKWKLRLPIPPELLSDGVQTFLIRMDEETLTHFTIVTGVPLEDDLRAEIDLLRAELDMLKRAFRRHCVETGA
ncbi:hypothetical protein C8J27_10597 [Rhodobacter aestuarii]|uniref:Uncharacterized protein n=1 Tax=Rhodobacter aestuarii TaxID=453582 RepID=A0A1N7LMQ5_9RHOB|nr:MULTISPECIES: hypothetical protein [Rhodobacter]PTV95153.1 hypothetical protein C8J27_10597 [Rhodobacter aestuarii]SIS75096.1 hypothetical protein SAMN05421580_104179 [Rhodobacter aestuarii]SOC07553.1 hypothetical protein SAMN05877809_10497 [Rhodobacter sp. JA431]